ncbi:hypothetical protein [Nocardia sp. NPDC019395]|uniref:hypothetical protein n=1 Tax=Nocardia sp. NPDC019395 TaxID=3154686 RepID=UPI0034050F00
MAVRYSKRDQTKLVNRVKKLVTQGKTLNAACTAVSEREGGQPSTNTLANWVKAAGLPEPAATPDPAPAPQKRRRRTRTGDTPVAAAAATVTPAVEPEQEPTARPEQETAPENTGSQATDTGADESPRLVPEPETAPAAELVHVRSADTAMDSNGNLDDLLDENLRLRTALSEANREIRAMRDLLVVYASR